MKICCITNDVEALSINGEVYDDIAQKVQNEALPALLTLYKKYHVKATFYCLASFTEQYPAIIHQIIEAGHEVACHGLVHDKDRAFDVLSLEEQTDHLKKAKLILEKISGTSVTSFRAPALRVNADTPVALSNAGFLSDSSVAPQRMDMFMSLGSKSKLQWFGAPRIIYHVSSHNLARKGNSSITEIPVSSFVFPYIGTLMRISSFMICLTRLFLFFETMLSENKVVCFLYHPSEAVAETDEQTKVKKRAKSKLAHFFSDFLRTKLKKRNLGPESLRLLEKELLFWSRKGYKFRTVSELI